MPQQKQFLSVISVAEARERWMDALTPLRHPGTETLLLSACSGRILHNDLIAPLDVTTFDRSLVDGFAVRAADVSTAEEWNPVSLQLLPEKAAAGKPVDRAIAAGEAMTIATGAALPRGADAVVMIEHSLPAGDSTEAHAQNGILISRSAAAGDNISYAGGDMSRGQTILFGGSRLTSRELGVAAAVGCHELCVRKRPVVAVLSTGNEVTPPGKPLPAGHVYDSNMVILSAAAEECGAEVRQLGILPDSEKELQAAIKEALTADLILMSGGTSKGEGDLSYQVVRELTDPGILVHGVAMKPGKPVCLAMHGNRPLIILPGFPTSAIMTFHEFAAPVIRQMSGHPKSTAGITQAELPFPLPSVRGRLECLLVRLLRKPTADQSRAIRPASANNTESPPSWIAYPTGRGSGAVSNMLISDGFIRIPAETERLDEGEVVEVRLLDQRVRPADLVFAGSHCEGVDLLCSRLQHQGFEVRTLYIGSEGGLSAAKKGHCDVAGLHLLNTESDQWNMPFLSDNLQFVEGYQRQQSIVVRPDDEHFHEAVQPQDCLPIFSNAGCRMVNRNRGSGTRLLIDQFLGGSTPDGYAHQPPSHHAVCAAVASGRADWGIAVQHVAVRAGLKTLPLANEHYDFAVHQSAADKPAVQAFFALLQDPEIRRELAGRGLRFPN